MKITKVSASFSAKKQIRQYEPIDIFMAVEAEVDATDDIDEVQHQLFIIAKEAVKRELKEILVKGGEVTNG